MKVAAIQLNAGLDVEANLLEAGHWIVQAVAAGARLVTLPENLPLMGLRERDKLAIAEVPGAGPIQDWLSRQAAFHGIYLLGGTIPLRGDDPERVMASSLLFGPDGGLLARYDKIHLFDVAVSGGANPEDYRESRSIAPGPCHPVVADVDGWRLGLSVCYDLRFPELYRALVTAGADVLCVPSAFTARTGAAHWSTLLAARAIENLCYVVASNQCGVHPNGRATWGHSCVISPWGDVLALQADVPGLAMATLERGKMDALRRNFPCLEHRRL